MMFAGLVEWTRKFRETHPFQPGRVLEIGSRNVNGSIRSLFSDADSYIGIDAVDGRDVDIVMQAKQIGNRWIQGSFDCVLAYETLEHDPTFWLTLEQIRWALRRDGMLIVTTPTFGFPEHRFPIDCYRFGRDAYRKVIFDGYDILQLDQIKTPAGSPCLCAGGRKR